MTDYHQPVLLHESVGGLNIKPDGTYVDATFGGGGHSREILKHLQNGKLVGFDQDSEVLKFVPDDERFIFAQQNFRFLRNFLKYYNITGIDGLLADLGVSSHHLDAAHRGFSFRHDSVIDMRMNQESSFSAIELLNSYSEEDLKRIFREYGELNNAHRISREIVKYRTNSSISSTRDLIEAISSCMPRQSENQFLAKVYQAVRIEVNHEIDYLKELLNQSLEFLKPGGRLVVISYHSIEDRVVKNFMRDGSFEEKPFDLYGNENKIFKLINKKVIVPDDKELAVNNRARSAKLRIAERV
jgi:16S rRNA (cytosine1402-N4)-methyltransferase